MKKVKPSLFIASLIIIFALSTFVSCSHHQVNNQNQNNDDAITRIYIGLSSRKLAREFEIADVEKILTKHFDGATVQESRGHYIGETEKNLIITIINCCRWEQPIEIYQNNIKNLIIELKQKLGQESILVEQLSSGNTEVFEIYE